MSCSPASEQDLLDIRNFGSKSIDEVKAKLAEMGLCLKDSAPGFDPSSVIDTYDDDDDTSLRRGRAVLTDLVERAPIEAALRRRSRRRCESLAEGCGGIRPNRTDSEPNTAAHYPGT